MFSSPSIRTLNFIMKLLLHHFPCIIMYLILAYIFIYNRMIQNKIAHWSRLGRLRRSNTGQVSMKYASRDAMVGRLICDLKLSAKELIRCKSYELGALAEKCLREGEEDKRLKLSADAVRKSYASTEALKSNITLCMRDADQTLR